MIPQSVTDRYATNLLRQGQNEDFRLDELTAHAWVQEEVICGHYYKAQVLHLTGGERAIKATQGVGPSPLEALINALTKAGVTFR